MVPQICFAHLFIYKLILIKGWPPQTSDDFPKKAE